MSTQTGKPARRFNLRVYLVDAVAYANDSNVLPFRVLMYLARANDRVGDVRLGLNALFSKHHSKDGQLSATPLRDLTKFMLKDKYMVSDAMMIDNSPLALDSADGDSDCLGPPVKRRRIIPTNVKTAKVPPSRTRHVSSSAQSPSPSQSSAHDVAALPQQPSLPPPTGVESAFPIHAAGQHVSAGTPAMSTLVATLATSSVAAVVDDVRATTTTATPEAVLETASDEHADDAATTTDAMQAPSATPETETNPVVSTSNRSDEASEPDSEGSIEAEPSGEPSIGDRPGGEGGMEVDPNGSGSQATSSSALKRKARGMPTSDLDSDDNSDAKKYAKRSSQNLPGGNRTAELVPGHNPQFAKFQTTLAITYREILRKRAAELEAGSEVRRAIEREASWAAVRKAKWVAEREAKREAERKAQWEAKRKAKQKAE
ncbi:hypothetical protein IWW38_000376 [Coemansia aciculifera]|uniref:Uncharacterized protein n=1 Tax=Coemansia aciculifera TaxID=417176 RepID=A0ACC1M9A1_9FUNG|nr:hypothetical protein IWW38_000376 [Coemansia aciculifera]